MEMETFFLLMFVEFQYAQCDTGHLLILVVVKFCQQYIHRLVR